MKEEFEAWVEAAEASARLVGEWGDLPPVEALVVDVYNPAPDLQRRAIKWGHEFQTGELPELLAFGAGLVEAERQAWADDRPDVATRALSDRRFLLGDRVLHWAVPWLESAGAHAVQARLLELGDLHRPEPELAGNEGLTAPGEDRFGTLDPVPLSSLLCGGVVLESLAAEWSTTREALHAGAVPPEARAWLGTQAERWDQLRTNHPGSAALWRDLASRARSYGSDR